MFVSWASIAVKQIKVVTDSYIGERMQGEESGLLCSSVHLWHENCGRPKFLITLHLLQSTWTVYAVNPFPSVHPSCFCHHKNTTSGRNSLTKKVSVLSQLWLSPLWNTTLHSLYIRINCLFLSFAVGFKWVTEDDFILCSFCALYWLMID